MMEKVIKVVGAILIEEGKILIAQRVPGRSLENMWEFPGGKIEMHETPREALIREIIEELKIQVQVEEEVFECTRYAYDFGTVELTTYRCQLIAGTPMLMEHTAIDWVTPEELDQFVFAPADIPAVEKLKAQGVE